ncbi:WD40 repeat domain-containing protein [uncultured Shewanella sp.]|uniref:WD40 repeat domain-containing protein n=1 Tax=uncultured Shewanella sp. TaxID=173975 RepID=UPI0026359D23|nr:WD40 repeat domain-containing protein [uncultured Shewanella sp.]
MKVIKLALLCACMMLTLTACSDPATDKTSLSTDRLTRDRVVAAQISADGTTSALLTRNHRLSVWDNQSKSLLNEWNESDLIEELYHISMSGDKRLLGTAGKHRVSIYDIHTGKLTVTWQVKGFDPEATITSLHLSHTGNEVLIGLNEGSVFTVDLVNGQISMFLLHDGPVTRVKYAAQNQQVMSASHDGNLLFWATTTGTVIQEYAKRFRITSVSYDEANRKLFIADALDNQFIADSLTAQTLTKLDYLERYRYFRQALFVDRGKMLITSSSKQELASWDARTGAELARWDITAFSAGTTVLSMAVDISNTLWSLSSDGALESWAIEPLHLSSSGL